METSNTDTTTMQPQSRKELRRERRQEKAALQESGKQRERYQKIMRGIIVALLVFGGAFTLWNLTQRSAPQSMDRSKSYPILGQEHIKIGASHPPYNSNPPTSGHHYEEPAKTGVYEEELPDEQLVHNLEHGEIWIAYHPRVLKEVVEALKQFDSAWVVIEPRKANETDIVVAAGGRLDAFNLDGKPLDTQRIKDFIQRYRNQGSHNGGKAL